MKNISLLSSTLLLTMLALPACGDDSNADADSDASGETGSEGSTTGNGECVTDPATANKVGVDADINEDTTWTCDNVYVLDGQIFVNGATLTIEAGTYIQGLNGSALVIEKDAMINAVGTPDAPIVMTSNSESPARGDWGGLVLLGDAPTNLGAPGTAEGFVNAPTYGGDDAAHNCGTMQYVRVEYAGFAISDGNELNGITFYACGTGTTVDHVQSHMGQDDGMEWFGGGFDASHLIVTGAADDSFDIDQGFQGNLQYLFIHQDPTIGDNCFEISNQGDDFTATPRTNPIVANATCVGSGAGGDKSKGITYKEGTNGQTWNSLITNVTNTAVLLTHPETQVEAEAGNLAFAGDLIWGNGDPQFDTDKDATWTSMDLETWITGSAGVVIGTDAGLGSAAWGSPDISIDAASPAATAGQTLPAGFEATTYAGAVDPAGADWTQEAWVNYAP